MRTTVTIDPDTEHLLKEEMRRTGLSFKQVLNQSIRRSLLVPQVEGEYRTVTPVFPAAFPAEFDNISFNRLADEIDDANTLRELGA